MLLAQLVSSKSCVSVNGFHRVFRFQFSNSMVFHLLGGYAALRNDGTTAIFFLGFNNLYSFLHMLLSSP